MTQGLSSAHVDHCVRLSLSLAMPVSLIFTLEVSLISIDVGDDVTRDSDGGCHAEISGQRAQYNVSHLCC